MNRPADRHHRPTATSRAPRRRRASVMVFVMAVLVLLALMGLAMMIAVRGERQKLTGLRKTLALDAIMDRSVLIVRERLRDDLLRDPSVVRNAADVEALRADPSLIDDPTFFDPNDLLGGDPNDPNFEGEPFDAPSPKDRWLASTIPWLLKWDPSYGPEDLDDPRRVLVWPRVSYLGDDLNLLLRWDGAFGDNPRDPNSALTNRLTAEGVPDFSKFFDPNVGPFDPDLILVDADGDGIPDSPISFTFPIDTPEPTVNPKRVHVAIRIVDNCSKINVNTAGLNISDPNVYERRGRRINDIVIDPNAASNARGLDLRCLTPVLDDPNSLWSTDPDSLLGSRIESLDRLGYDPLVAEDANQYSRIIRGPLFTGAAPGLYTPSVETALTRRNVLISREAGVQNYPTTPIERSLPETLTYSREGLNVPTDPNYRYWWRRFDLDNQNEFPRIFMNSQLYFVFGMFRRSLFTTRSFDVLRRGRLDLPSTGKIYLINGVSDNGVIIREDIDEIFRQKIGYEKLDLNYVNPDDPNDIRWWLIGVANYLYGGRIVGGANNTERVLNAYQLALNILDYRDPDSKPTVLTEFSSPTKVAIAGVEQQPFLTEGYVVWVATEPDDEVILTKYVAVEVFLPLGWLTGSLDLDKLLLRSGTNEIKLSAFEDAPQLVAGQYHVFYREADPVLPLGPGRIDAVTEKNKHVNDSFGVLAGGVELLYDPDGDGGMIAPYPIDRLDDPGGFWSTDPVGLEDGDWQLRTMQRNTNGWRFTVASYGVKLPVKKSGEALPSLGAENVVPPGGVAPLAAKVAPCPWWFKNVAWPDPADPEMRTDPNYWAFDSPGDLSRVLAVANDPNDPNGTVPWKLMNAQAKYRASNVDPNYWVGAGRLDFMRQDPNRPVDPNGAATNVFDYFTTIGVSNDGIDNDGDEAVDEANPDAPAIGIEADDIGYRVPGRININTAPEYVLRAVPFFYDDRDNPKSDPNQVDFAAGIVTFREARPVVSPAAAASGYSTQPPASATQQWFTSLGDLTRIRRGNSDLTDLPAGCKLDYYGTNIKDLVGLPDYDYDPDDPNKQDGVKDDVRERDILLSRAANVLTVRSDTYTVYIALIDSELNADGSVRYLGRCQFTLDRTNCLTNPFELPYVISRVETNYYDDTR